MTDKEIITDPDSWPCWPVLPLKRKNNSLEDKNLGILLAGKLTVYHVYMFDIPQDLSKEPKTKYNHVDELLADGWRVD